MKGWGELHRRHVDLCRDRGAGRRAERDGFGGAVEPRSEAFQVQRDRELEAVEDVLRRLDALRRALDRGAGSVADMKRKRVRGPRNQDGDRGAPSGAHGGAHERAHVRAQPDVRIQPCVEPAGKRRRPVSRLPQAARHGTSGSVHRKRALRPVDSDLPIHTLCEEVVSRCHRDSEAGLTFDAAYAPATEHLGLIGRQRPVAQANDRPGREVRAEGRLMPQAGREGEGRKVDDRVRGPRGHVETMHEVELNDSLTGPSLTWNRCTKLNCTTPGSGTHVPPRFGGRYSRDCAPSGAAAMHKTRANQTRLMTDLPV